MRRLVDIDLLGDAQLQADMANSSMLLFLVGTVMGLLGAVALPHEPVTRLWFLLLALVSVAALPIHELVHAIAFKVFSGFEAHIAFGFSDWMLYTTAPGCILPRRRFMGVLMAPSVVVTIGLYAGALYLGSPLMAWFLAVIHLTGCTGDFGYVRVILSEPMATLVQDTERGIALYHDD